MESQAGIPGVRRVQPGERVEGQATPGMRREEAIVTDLVWSGLVKTDPGMVSGWHHHGEYETSIYVVSGAMTMEFGPEGRDVIEAHPGDFIYVAPHAVHRESNPTDSEASAVVVRAGNGPVVFNVDGPERPPRASA